MSEPSQAEFERVLLRPSVSGEAGLVHLEWSAAGLGADRVVQVYVNGRLYDTVLDAGERELWLGLDRAGAARIELLAVDVSEAWVDRSPWLAGWSPRFETDAELAVLRDEALSVGSPAAGRAVVSVDGVEDAGHPFWRGTDARNGFGGLFGIGAFGHDLATGPGLGLGEFGAGPFGGDGAAWRWRRDDLSAGEHTLGLHVEDETGRVVGELGEPVAVSIEALPREAEGVELGGDFTLAWA